MALRKRASGLICLLLVTAAAMLLAGRPTSARPIPPAQEEQDAAQTLEDDALQYEEPSPVRIISLKELEPVDTAAKNRLCWGAEGLFIPADAAEMADILAELNLDDGTCIRLYATAEGLVYGAFLRPESQWIRFIQLYDGRGRMPDYTQGVTLTAFSGVLGEDGFLLRTGDPPGAGIYRYRFYWFDSAGELRVVEPCLDPVSLDLDGGGEPELVYEVAEWWSGLTFFHRAADGSVYQVSPGQYIGGGSAVLEAMEAEGPGPVRLIFRYRETDGGEWKFCAATLEDGALKLEMDIVYVPAQIQPAPLPADPTDGRTRSCRLSVTGPGGQGVEDAGAAAEEEFWAMLWSGSGSGREGAVLIPTDAPLDETAAYTVTFTPETGTPLSWTLDGQGVCRFSGLEGNYRMASTGWGSLPEWCWDTMALYCRAAA